MRNPVEKLFKTLLPTPFTIALVLTFVTFLLAYFLTDSKATGIDRIIELANFWGGDQGLWRKDLLAFAVQMMLMLVLGHALALTKPVDSFIKYVTRYCVSTASAAGIVTFLTITLSLFNWGLGLIFGAILARKVGENAAKNSIKLNYPLIGAAGYSGLMVWHGGISGNAPIKAAESGHIAELMEGVVSKEQLAAFPDPVSFSDTIFGGMNISVMLGVVIILPVFMYMIGKRSSKSTELPEIITERKSDVSKISGAERLDNGRFFPMLLGLLIGSYVVYLSVNGYLKSGFGFINPNYLNLLLFSLCLVLHRNINSFLKAIDEAIGGAAGILIQFPLYFGIMGIMTGSGLVQVFSDFFVGISNETSFPIFTFISAGIVNVFVPSGGGQWMVQGPIILQAALELGVSAPKSIMALAYGDQLTNMLQPFWALPLLGITGLKATSILPYTLALMGMGILIFVSALLIF